MDLKKVFGSGPLCLILGFFVILTALYLESLLAIPEIDIPDNLAFWTFIFANILTVAVITWGVVSLPPGKRGNELITDKAFRYFRHPLYAGFLDFFIFGLGIYLKSYGVLLAGVILIIVCGRIVGNEERYLIELFGLEYRQYQKRTKMFIPWLY